MLGISALISTERPSGCWSARYRSAIGPERSFSTIWHASNSGDAGMAGELITRAFGLSAGGAELELGNPAVRA